MWALSDKYWRKPVLLLTQGWTFISWLILWLAYFLPSVEILGLVVLPLFVIFISRIIDGITWWNMSVVSAMVADITTPEERSTVFGKTGAVMWTTLIIGPSIWAFSMESSYWYLATAIVWAIVSIIALWIMFYKVEETLKEEDTKKELHISYKDLNIIKKIKKYWGQNTVQFSIVIKIFMMFSFMMYTTVSVLYLIDRFWFSAATVWYYLIITWSFVILHQAFSVKPVVQKIGDFRWLLLGQTLMGLGYLGMWLSPDIYYYTFAYFFAILGITLSMSTLQALFSKWADKKSQWEIMWIASSLESFVAIIAPIVGALLYERVDISIFIIISIVPFIGLLIYIIFFRKKLLREDTFCN